MATLGGRVFLSRPGIASTLYDGVTRAKLERSPIYSPRGWKRGEDERTEQGAL